MNRKRYWFNFIITAASAVVLTAPAVLAAVGCTLNDPDRDVKRIFPDSTGYQTRFITIEETGGQEMYEKVQKQLGDEFDDVYETIDVPYAFYDVKKGNDLIGRVHGVNQKGQYGGLQLILATDPSGKILDFYYQKISSPEARAFRDESFTGQFDGVTLKTFDKKTAGIKNPADKSAVDFKATLRGLKKNLILLHAFLINKEDSSHE